MLMAFFHAQHINAHSGGAVIAPWELEPGHTPDEWAETALALSNLSTIRKRRKAEQKYLEQVRRAHPQYSKTHHLRH